MAKASEALAKGDLAGAWRHLDRVDSEELYREAQEKLRKIEETVTGRLGEAQALESIGGRAGQGADRRPPRRPREERKMTPKAGGPT